MLLGVDFSYERDYTKDTNKQRRKQTHKELNTKEKKVMEFVLSQEVRDRRKSGLITLSIADQVKTLSDDLAGAIFKGYITAIQTGDTSDTDHLFENKLIDFENGIIGPREYEQIAEAKAIWKLIKADIEANDALYAKKSAQNAKNGAKGGKATKKIVPIIPDMDDVESFS